MSGEFAGTLQDRIEIDRPVAVRNAMGLQEEGWELVARCLAAVTVDGVGAEAEAMALSAMPRFRVTIRWREGVSVGQRVRWRGRLLLVRQLIEDPRTRDRIVMRCEEARP